MRMSSAPFPPFPSGDDFHTRELAPGVTARILSLERVMLCEVTLAPDGIVPPHDHPHDQAGRCLEGEFELEIEGDTRVIREGESYLIPGGARHSARALGSRAVTLDIFSPPREEYLPGAEGPAFR